MTEFHGGKRGCEGRGGGKGIRTPGLFIANEALYQLSYTPGCGNRPKPPNEEGVCPPEFLGALLPLQPSGASGPLGRMFQVEGIRFRSNMDGQ